MEEHPEGLVVFATLEWVCEGCGALNIHDYPQDGRVRAIECQACRSPGCLIVPSGRGMLPEKAVGMYVVCDACGAQRDPTVRGCWKCDGLGHEPAGGRVVKAGAKSPLPSGAADWAREHLAWKAGLTLAPADAVAATQGECGVIHRTLGRWRKGRDDMTTVDDRHGWSKAVYVDDPRGGVHKPTGEPLPFVVGVAYGETEEEAHANAAMFAAGPDLLAAAKAMHLAIVRHKHPAHDLDQPLRDLMAAIASAEKNPLTSCAAPKSGPALMPDPQSLMPSASAEGGAL